MSWLKTQWLIKKKSSKLRIPLENDVDTFYLQKQLTYLLKFLYCVSGSYDDTCALEY